MKVFFDNCTSPVLADVLNGYLLHRGDSAVHIKDAGCGRHASDVKWIAFLSETGDDWLVVTGDRRLHKNRAERVAFRQAKLCGLVLAPAYQKTPINQQAAILVWRWPDVEGLLNFAAPFLFEMPISKSGKIKSLPV